MATIAPVPGTNQAPLIERSRERLRALLATDPELQRAVPSDDASEAIRSCPTTIESVAKAFELYAGRACFGERTAGSPAFRMTRYDELWARVAAFATGLVHEKLVTTGDFVGICGFGSIDWIVTDLACLYLAAVSVPLQTGMSAIDMQQIIRETELTCIVCSAEQVSAIEAVLPQCPSVRSVVVMDLREGDRVPSLANAGAGVRTRTLREVEDRGQREILPKVLPSARNEPDPLMTLVYTSGSTGTPKGAMSPESLFHRQWQMGFIRRLSGGLEELPHISVSYMPLNHAAGRFAFMQSIMEGGTSYFIAKSDMSTIFEDIQLARPTSLLLVPRVAEMIHQRYQSEVARRSSKTSDNDGRAKIAAEVMSEMGRSFLGDRLLRVTTGSAPTPSEVTSFLKQCFEVPVLDTYGSTEAGLITFEDIVAPDVSWRLVDVPDLGYRTTDQPYPRGELHVKTPSLVPGYYKNEAATKGLFDEAGFLNTGDIVEQRGPDCLVWIDRAKNILKLSQGEYVATSRLEGIYASRSPLLRQVFLYGNSARSYLLAVVVPLPDVPNDAGLKSLVRSELLRVANEEHLHGYEVPRDFLIAREPFTTENGLLTDSKKPARARLRALYGERLEALYVDIERAKVDELYGLRGERSAQSVAEKVKKAMAATVGLADIEMAAEGHSFIQLGGDSLSAVGLEALLYDICGVHVPLGFLLDPTSSVRAVADFVENALAGGTRRAVTFEEIHGAGATVVRAEDLRIERFLSRTEIDAARAASPRDELPPHAKVVLLTGANGFLGRFLALDILEQLAAGEGHLYTIVRAPNDAVAFERLASTYQTDPALAARFAEAAGKGRLTVLAGDLMKPRFGLTDETYERIAREVDAIVHNGALVNHALGYAQLFEPNVLGTVEVIRFSLAGRAKSIAYVSTLGVLGGLERIAASEDDDLRILLPERPTAGGYAAGYAGTKWASELLLRDAHDALGVPVMVFRPSEIMAHGRYIGQVNVPDFFTRLLVGIVYTGIAPGSFYAKGAPEQAKHLDGLPVDAVAAAILAPVLHRRADDPTYATYHVLNPCRGDGISLDVVVSWVRSAGYRVDRISDYDAWYRTFHDRLVALNEPQRHYSPLAILHAWAHPEGADQPFFDNPRLLVRLRTVEGFAGLPQVTEALIHKYLDDLAMLHVIERPLRMAG